MRGLAKSLLSITSADPRVSASSCGHGRLPTVSIANARVRNAATGHDVRGNAPADADHGEYEPVDHRAFVQDVAHNQASTVSGLKAANLSTPVARMPLGLALYPAQTPALHNRGCS